MTFMEFLDGMGASGYRKRIENIEEPEPIPEALHNNLNDLLRQYYFTGGMPEAVKRFAETGNASEVREIQHEIIKSYILDFIKHAPAVEIPKLTQIWDSLPKQLAKEKKKFFFNAVKKGARAREYENGITWLMDAGLIYRATAIATVKRPLKHYADNGCFKIYVLDVGLLGGMSETPLSLLANHERLFTDFKGAFVENYVAQQLTAHTGKALHYWRSKGGKAELDFLCEVEENVYPLEVKVGSKSRNQSTQ